MAGTGPAMTAKGGTIYSYFQNFLLDAFRFIEYQYPVPFLPKGRLAIVTDAERDAVDVGGAIDEQR